MKQKTTLTKVIGFIFIVIGFFGLSIIFIDVIGYPVSGSNRGLVSIAFAIIIAAGAWLIHDYKSDD